jgi:diguanylate cyclase (GGDEF)-like protein
MKKSFRFRHEWIDRFNGNLELFLLFLSSYILPIVIGLMSLTAVLIWDSANQASDGVPLKFRLLESKAGALSPEQAAAQLENRPYQVHHDTRRSEIPFWVSFRVNAPDDSEPVILEFPSRHAMSTTCWDATSFQPLGNASRNATDGGMYFVKAGFALELRKPEKTVEVLCRAAFVGPARISVYQSHAAQLQLSDEQFHRNSGLLDGGLVILAMFVFVTFLINRENLYILFATWLIANLRMGALSAGWDTHWFGYSVPEQWLLLTRSVTMASFYMLTVVLFKSLFREELLKVGYGYLLRVSQWTCFPLLVLSVNLPYREFLPILWISSGFTIFVLLFLIVRILILTESKVAVWYAASIGITLAASLNEVVSAALGYKDLIFAINSVTAALSSSLLASLAIAEQMRKEHAQRLDIQAELKQTFDAMPIGLFTLDLQGYFMSANPALIKMLGRDVLRPGRNSWQQYFNAAAWLQLYQLVNQHQGGELECRSSGSSWKDEPRRYLVKATRVHDRIEGSLQDVTEKSIATDELNFLANNDSLTKVLNRRGIEQVFKNAVAQVDEDHPLAMAYLDLDRFKLINDLYGHNAGDELLKQVCQRVSSMLSGNMRVGRVGGDEFVIVLPDTPMPLATVICRGIVDSIDNTPYRVGEKAFHVRGSIGLIEIGRGTLMKEALSTSDRACREAKSGPHKGLVVYERDAPAFREHEAEIRLIERLSASETIEGLFIEMQPIMSLTQPNNSLNFEVLLRMRDPEGKLVPVSRVIAAGEQSGRMGVIDRWVLSTTLAWLDQHRARLQNTQFVCMNLSGASWNDEEFMEEVFELLRSNSHVVSFLSIEITESVALNDLQNTRRFIDKVRSFGARVALDDFGAGYTSFSYLKELPADLLKIDGSFIVNMNRHPANVSIVEAIVNLARNLGMKTIAEWAEDAATVQTLSELGVDYVQGFVVARPMAPEALIGAHSAASFIKDEALLQIVSLLGKPEDDMTNTDLILQSIQEIPRKIH